MKKISSLFLSVLMVLSFAGCSNTSGTDTTPDSSAQTMEENAVDLNVAVEYTDHAASFYYANEKGLFQDSGININDVKVYASGVGVAAAFTKGGFEVSYMCLVPAIYTYANGGVPIKIIAGTHKN